LGRNFNAGEVIQLVLKDKAGRWLSFKFVQMVMMHELAHCKQMNHSRYFWNERNRFASHMEELWSAGYKGEGLWGRGQDLTSGIFVPDRMPDDVDIPPHLCGGSYRRGRGRKRKRGQDSDKPKVTYAERQQKRIAKKFGIHGEGQSLGEDDLVRGALEQGGKRHYGKPRVANSKRGRELRASAALARFEAAKNQQEKTPELIEDDGSETESEDELDEFADGLNIFETLEKIKDQQGRDLYKVCGDEGEQDEGGENEMEDLRRMGAAPSKHPKAGETKSKSAQKDDSETESETNQCPPPVHKNATKRRKTATTSHDDSETESEVEEVASVRPGNRSKPNGRMVETASSHSIVLPSSGITYLDKATPAAPATSPSGCPICSLENEPDSVTCMACAHVLKPSLMRNHWRCTSEACKGSKYLNAGDVGRCGICGSQKPAPTVTPMGITGGDVLRWD
jgi:DNA-dependent metalloprotease WSS1